LRTQITLAIHAGIPTGTEDDLLLAQRLSKDGIEVRLAVWDDPQVDWSLSGPTILRSTWDYHWCSLPEN
jgi:hypothetical protein